MRTQEKFKRNTSRRTVESTETIYSFLSNFVDGDLLFLFILNNKYNVNKSESRGFSEQRPPERSENRLSSLSERTVPGVA